MNQNIKAIFFDIGNTLVNKVNHGYRDLSVIDEMVRFLNLNCSSEELVAKITTGEIKYKSTQSRTLADLPLEERWTKFILPDYPEDFIRNHAAQLQDRWSESRGKKWIPEETTSTLRELSNRGYILGTISHTSPKYLQESSIGELFHTNIHAAKFGRRKPHPSIFLAAARDCGVHPQACAYIGDRPSRDVVGPREAGFGKVILFQPLQAAAEKEPCPMQADKTIRNITELLDIFPPLINNSPVKQEAVKPVLLYDAALSTMWWNKELDTASDFFGKGRALGFARFELNHQIPLNVMKVIDFNTYHIGTLHDPCPAVLPTRQMEREDRVVTSLDESLRQSGIDAVKRTIEYACRLGARSVVIHLGRIVGDHSMDDHLRDLYQQGLKETSDYESLRTALIEDRKARVKPHMDALMKSLGEIIAFAQNTGLSLGFENRFHYYELPIFEEMEVLLAEFQQPWAGWQFDVGHLQVHYALGLTDFQNWLEHFGDRIVGIHMHDVQGILDHRAPGSGDVNFKQVADYLPPYALRTLEVDKSLSYEEVCAGMKVLEDAGCVTRI